jgi:hypothetical protein
LKPYSLLAITPESPIQIRFEPLMQSAAERWPVTKKRPRRISPPRPYRGGGLDEEATPTGQSGCSLPGVPISSLKAEALDPRRCPTAFDSGLRDGPATAR